MKAIYVSPSLPARLIDTSIDQIRADLGWVSIAYPFEDDVAFVHDDDGIANGRLPNRTIGSEIMPGPFYILSVDDHGELKSLQPQLIQKYLEMFKTPEQFPSGHWKIHNTVEETEHTAVIRMVSEWVVDDDTPVAIDHPAASSAADNHTDGGPHLCPYCNRSYSSPPALSRLDNSTLCCPRCGSREALEAAGINPSKIEEILTAMYGDGAEVEKC